MLKEKHIKYLQDLLSDHIEDAKEELNAAKEDNEGIEEAKEALDDLTEINMALEVMKEATERSSDIEDLRTENAMLHKLLQSIAGNLRDIADEVSNL
ncbi:MAG: hypothetical protein Q3993_08305 [Filifactor alocis]|nr:hypothetical protein [Filifactor alocis]